MFFLRLLGNYTIPLMLTKHSIQLTRARAGSVCWPALEAAITNSRLGPSRGASALLSFLSIFAFLSVIPEGNLLLPFLSVLAFLSVIPEGNLLLPFLVDLILRKMR